MNTNALSNEREDATFIKIVAGTGKFHMSVDDNEEGNDGIVVREGEVNGKKFRKVERTFDTLKGIIKAIDIKDSEYGTNLYIKVENIIIAVPVDNSFGQDLMKKLPNIDITKNVIFKPYSFTNDKNKDVRGVSIIQDEQKILNFFVNSETKEELYGYPAFPQDYESWPEGDKKDNWKVYRIQVTKFLKNYIIDNHKLIDETRTDNKNILEENDEIPGWGNGEEAEVKTAEPTTSFKEATTVQKPLNEPAPVAPAPAQPAA